MGRILLKNITLDGSRKDIFISDGLISSIVPAGSAMECCTEQNAETLDCSGKVAVPGFINSHTHAAMTLMRGVGEDIAFHEWLDRIWKIECNLDEELIYWGTKVACLEMAMTGTTTFNDQYWIQPYAVKAASEMGMNMVCSYVLLDNMDPAKTGIQKEECMKLYEESRKWGDNASFAVSIHAVYSVSEELVRWGAEFARSKGVKIHMHISETEKEVADCKQAHGGLSPVEYFDSLGVLGPDVIAAHTLWLSENDIRILGERGVSCVHNINSNLKLASGYKFPYNELKQAGANLCIGTDGCASSNNLDILEAMKTSAIVQKAWRNDPSALPVNELMDMATVNGAKALGLNTGVIKEGYRADISIVNIDSTYFLSQAPFLANLIYSANSGCIESVISGGKFIMKDRTVPGSGTILAEARRILDRL